MKVKTFIVSSMETNCYVVFDEESENGIVIDPGDGADLILDFIKKENIKICAIVLTHTHFDHIGAVPKLKSELNVPVCVCEGEEKISQNAKYNLSALYSTPIEIVPDKVFKDGEIFKFGTLEFSVIKTPGHTPGGCCFYFEKFGILFSGDTLFLGSVGRTDFELGSLSDLISAIKTKIMTLPDEVMVYCGHGQGTKIGFERRNNPWIAEDADLF